MSTSLKVFVANEDGATAMEYGLIASLISVAIITAVSLVGSDVSGVYNNIASHLTAATPSS